MHQHADVVAERAAGAKRELSGTIRTHFELLLQRNPALKFVCLCTADGVLVEHESINQSMQADRIAAMTSSALALSESFSKEALLAGCNYSVIYSDAGSIVMVRVPAKNGAYTLSVGSDSSAVLAATLRTALDTAQRISTAIL